MTKKEKIAREFIAYLNLVVSGAVYYTTFPAATYCKKDIALEDATKETFVNVDHTTNFEESETYKESTVIMVSVGCRKGENTPSYLEEMIEDAVRAIYLNRFAIQRKFNLCNNIMPVGTIQKEIERGDLQRGVADIYFNVPIKENASWYMETRELT